MPSTGYAPIGDLRMYYEIHGEPAQDGVPLLLLHGGLFDIDQQFGGVIGPLAERRQVVAVDFQGHGRTNDIDRAIGAEPFAADVVAALDHLEIPVADVWGYSIGGAVGIELAVNHPDRVRKLIASSVSFSPEGDRGENSEAVGAMTVDMIAGTPMEAAYLAKSPHPDHEHLQGLLDKLSTSDAGFPGWSEDQIRGIAAPTLITVGDCDAVRLDHAVRFLQLRGGDVNGDFEGVPASQLAVLPGTTHFLGMANSALVLEIVTPFLDKPVG